MKNLVIANLKDPRRELPGEGPRAPGSKATRIVARRLEGQ